MMVGLFVIGASMALLNTMTWALEADTVEYGEWKTHIRTEGATYAAFSFTRKCGQAAGASLVGLALWYYGYVSAVDGEAQPQPKPRWTAFTSPPPRYRRCSSSPR